LSVSFAPSAILYCHHFLSFDVFFIQIVIIRLQHSKNKRRPHSHRSQILSHSHSKFTISWWTLVSWNSFRPPLLTTALWKLLCQQFPLACNSVSLIPHSIPIHNPHLYSYQCTICKSWFRSSVTSCTCKYILTNATTQKSSILQIIQTLNLNLDGQYFLRNIHSRIYSQITLKDAKTRSLTDKHENAQDYTQTYIHVHMQIWSVHNHTYMRPRSHVNAYRQSFWHAYPFTLTVSHTRSLSYIPICNLKINCMDISDCFSNIIFHSFACAWKQHSLTLYNPLFCFKIIKKVSLNWFFL